MGEVVSKSKTVTVPAGTFNRTLKIRETTPREPGVEDFKIFARGVGMIQAGDLRLVSQSGG